MQQESKPRFTRDAAGRVLIGITHGGHVLADDSENAEELAGSQEGIVAAAPDVAEDDSTTPFGYLLADLAAAFPAKHLPNSDPPAVVAALKALGAAMVEDPPPAADPLEPEGNSTIPPIYTYWGQFIDHDLTANTDRDSAISDITRPDLAPLTPADVARDLRNLRQPALNLDTVYGDGPTFDPSSPTDAAAFYDGIKLKVGAVGDRARPTRRTRSTGCASRPTTTSRATCRAWTSSPRSATDATTRTSSSPSSTSPSCASTTPSSTGCGPTSRPTPTTTRSVFKRARELTRWHYQWLVVHDYLKTVTMAGIVDEILLGGNEHCSSPTARSSCRSSSRSRPSASATAWCAAATTTTATSGGPGRRLPAQRVVRPAVLFTGNGRPTPFFGADRRRCRSTGSSSGTASSTRARRPRITSRARSTPASRRRSAT